MGPGQYRVDPGALIVVAPFSGIETASANEQLAAIGTVAAMPHTALVAWGHGIWAFRYGGRQPTRWLLARPAPSVPGWALPTASGHPVLEGPAADWHMRGGRRTGYVVHGAYWRLPPGRYIASVKLSSTLPVVVEVWNASGRVLLARRTVPAHATPWTVRWAVTSSTIYPHHGIYQGWGAFQVQPVTPPSNDELEVRVWSPGGGVVDVYRVGLRSVRRPTAP